jgi:hypothetical protein
MGKRVSLDQVAYAHAGEKGDVSTVMVIPFRYEDFDLLVEQLTPERVKALFGELVKGRVERYLLPGPRVLNFPMYEAMDGGASKSMQADRIGKTRANLMYRLEVEVPDGWVPPKVDELGRVH